MLSNFWFISLCALVIIAANVGLSIPLRIALAANAVIILVDVFKKARRLYNDRHKEEK